MGCSCLFVQCEESINKKKKDKDCATVGERGKGWGGGRVGLKTSVKQERGEMP